MENRVTEDQIKSKIKSEVFLVMPDCRTTICQLVMENGYTVHGYSACVDIGNFDAALGRLYAYQDAFEKIWPLEGYLLAEKLYWDHAVPVASNPAKKVTNWTAKKRGKKIVAKLETDDAPYGLKKDGTPAKKRGRKAS
jgi:hypothetical protein